MNAINKTESKVYLVVQSNDVMTEHALDVAKNQFESEGADCVHVEFFGSRVMVMDECTFEQLERLEAMVSKNVHVLTSNKEMEKLVLAKFNQKLSGLMA